MYDLDYLYLADLDIDTSRSARDITASALFISINDADYITPVSCVTNRFVDWFFTASNPNIPKLDITFKHAYLSGDALTDTGLSSLIPLSALSAAISSKLTDVFNAMKTKLCATISTLTVNNVIPVGTVVLNSTNSTSPSGTWTCSDNCFIGETRTTATGDISSRALSAVNLSSSTMPAHKHEVILSPKTMSKTAKISSEVTGNGAYMMPVFGSGGLAIKTEELDEAEKKIIVATDHYDGGPDQFESTGNNIKSAYTENLVKVSPATGSTDTKSQNIAPPITQISDVKIFTKTALTS